MTVTGVEFHPLTVAAVEPLTDESVAVTFQVPEDLRDRFRYLPGQHVTVRREIDGRDIRRSYSICADANRGTLRVGIKRLADGAFSTWATTQLQPGEVLEVTGPVGDFTIAPDPASANHYGAIVAGSGITPVLSLVSTTLESEPNSRWTVIYGNRAARTVMFLDELEGLKDRHPDRLQIIHVLSREDPGLDLFSGRIDQPKLEALFETVVDADRVARWFLCGPFEMVTGARSLLLERGVASDDIRDELFFAGPPTPVVPPPEDDEPGTVHLTVILDGRASDVRMRPETRVLDAAMSVRSELPYSCKGGMCATCKAKVVEGAVRMEKNYALVDSDLEQGFVLTCQSHPVGDRLVVDYDQR
ncbi:MAG TPA: 1,2-phenylacetyl-CoA epoxidase subunit PaaE [Acidimicrobiia bacterium]|nr:1,2-phenylacetyl-CoA epoxidase subunit PaaE [Acidimicrobiia bacterium]